MRVRQTATTDHAQMLQPVCSWCQCWPCLCRPHVRVRCVCGEYLKARDDLESKRQAAALHVRSAQHRRWAEGLV